MAVAVPDGYLTALAGAAQVSLVADVLHGTTTLYRGLPVMGGRLTVDATARVRRQVSLTLAPALPTGPYSARPALPERIDAAHPLSWHGPQIVLRHGLILPSGQTVWVPLGAFRIDSASGSPAGTTPVEVAGVSREAWLIGDTRGQGVYTVTSPQMATDLIRARVAASATAAAVQIAATTNRLVPASTAQDGDAWATVERLARSIGCAAYADPGGTFVIAPIATERTAPVATISAGPGGLLVEASGGGSRQDAYGAVAVTGTGMDGTTVRALARNTTAGSPTRYGDPSTGAYGWDTLEISDPTIATYDDALRMASGQLALHTGLATTLTASSVPLPHLDGGDVVDVIPDATWPAGSVRRHVIDRIDWDLTPGGAYTLSTRDVGSVTA